jgi:sialate O-acetylesterase
MFTVGRKVADVPQADVAGGRWEAASPDTVGRFSAVAYFFGRALRRARKVPVGLIHSSWGGTPAEAWTNRSALEAWGLPSSAFKAIVHGQPNEDYERRVATWKAAGSPQGRYDDPGVAPLAKAWALAETDTGDWRPMLLPQRWENSGPDMEIDGGVWFRREIEIPAAWAGRELDLRLGAIDDFDTTYFNGVNVGATGAETPNFWEAPRRYQVPKEIVKAGRAVVAVRVWDHGGAGGLMGPADAMWIAPKTTAPDGPRTTLTGDWRFKIEASRPSHPGTPPGSDPNAPAVLYNGMIAPLLSYVIKGAIWYQGESNAGRAYQYRSLLSTMIRNWREAWGVGPFPFLIVELAPFMAIRSEPEESAWAELREAQHAVTKVLPNVGVAVITDAGDERDIHPKNKEPAGERLALAARRLAYGENVAASGPTYRAMRVALGKAIVSFEHVGKGLEVRGPRLTGFAIAGADKKFVWADAVVEGDVVVVSSPNVPAPAHVRFGWANYPVVNLWNKDGLPAAPFRTDAP